MHHLDEEELAHVGKILKKGYYRVHKPKKKERVKDILFSIFYSLLAILFLALGVLCIYWVVQGRYVIVALPGFIIAAALLGISLREIHLTLDNYMPPFASKIYVKSPPNFLPEPEVEDGYLSRQFSTTSFYSQSLHNFNPEETTSTLKSTSDDEVVKYSTLEESVQFGRDPKMIRSVSQYVMDNVPNQDQISDKTDVAQSTFSSSRKRFCHNFELEEGLMEMKTLPLGESSIPVGTKEVDEVSLKSSSQSLPAIKFMSKSDT